MSAEADSAIHDQVVHQDERTQETNRVILIPVDESQNSRYAIEWSIENFLRPKSDIVVLTHVRPLYVSSGTFATGYVDMGSYATTIEDQYREGSHRLLKEYAHILKDKNILCKAIAMRGDAREEILRKAVELKADMVIMGSRGLGTLKRALLGSVSDYCAHNLPMPLVIVKEKEKH
ncbi:adenine nucleotide alpha hydrolases-like protein [Basidiobolus meristosporus CBS 931.73]|uniref:Adenine nucleotide alpha hydrolases-like protein n=1 Tax=Basidiobolus meristosporus CBS 931.73 TaxID=1314790 RepID=A0A1Y1WVT8_9FUNG|nr:adenine nucleotide alpha hydrolases-like protein [Basidiobolus meristosporus CBS 931.73]|eukprot:ORX77515.1 adenine nucleotide alpha hydrolases-like protein [Basidiobolus meristosporus CBS 931.73]